MIVCDRCGKEMNFVEPRNRKSITMYSHEYACFGKSIDLCNDCLCVLNSIESKMQSYFMVNKDNPNDIFNDVKYWSN